MVLQVRSDKYATKATATATGPFRRHSSINFRQPTAIALQSSQVASFDARIRMSSPLPCPRVSRNRASVASGLLHLPAPCVPNSSYRLVQLGTSSPVAPSNPTPRHAAPDLTVALNRLAYFFSQGKPTSDKRQARQAPRRHVA